MSVNFFNASLYREPWWNTKVICGFLLIFTLIAIFVWQLIPTLPAILVVIGQMLVLLGGLLTIYHYLLLKRKNAKICQPTALIKSGGLFNRVRHPMYLGDSILYIGLWLMAPALLSLPILLIGLFALYQQSRVEDQQLEQRFGASFIEWQAKTRLMIPWL